jgi:hypothetical protein
MPHYLSYGKLDTPIAEDGDQRFLGIDMRRDRGILQPGMVARSENKRMWTGRMETRTGMSMAIDFNPAFEGLIIGTGVFQNTISGGEILLIATQGATYVWACQDGKDPVKIDIDDDSQPTTGFGPCEFVQCFTSIRLLRYGAGVYYRPLEWDGDITHDFEPSPAGQTSGSLIVGHQYTIFQYVSGDDFTNVGAGSNATGTLFTATGTTPTDWTHGSELVDIITGSSVVPPTITGEPFENRILFYNPRSTIQSEPSPGRDQFLMTDILDSTSYDPVLGVFNINTAQSDIIIRLWPFFHQGVVIFLKRSIWLQTNFTIEPLLTTQQQLNSAIGLVAQKGVLLVGGDTLFLSEPGGIYRLSEVIQQNITTEPVPITEPIDPLIRRINWQSAYLPYVVATALVGDYAYFAVPLDESAGGSNALLVYNTVSRMWESVDTWPESDFRINSLHVIQVAGRQSCLAVDFFGQRVILLESGSLTDGISDDDFPIQDVVETRGYILGNPFGMKKYHRMTMAIRSFDPGFKVTALRDGYNDEIPLANGDVNTKDKTKFYRAEHKDFNILTDDPNEPLREDYSFSDLNDYIVDDFRDLPAGNNVDLHPIFESEPPGQKQETLERFAVGTYARALSLRIENQQGQCDILSISIEGRPIENTQKVIA